MNAMNVVRIAKVIALLAFVLPWVAVSCNNVDVATASGIELIQGKMSANPNADAQMQQQMSGQLGGLGGGGLIEGDGGPGGSSAGTNSMSSMAVTTDLGMNFFAVGTALAIAAGLLLSLVGKGKTAARNVMVTSLIAIVMMFGTVWWWKESIKRQPGADGGMGGAASASPFGGAMGGMGGNMIDSVLQERIGYWLALTALVVAAGAGAIGTMQGAQGAAAIKPEGEV